MGYWQRYANCRTNSINTIEARLISTHVQPVLVKQSSHEFQVVSELNVIRVKLPQFDGQFILGVAVEPCSRAYLRSYATGYR